MKNKTVAKANKPSKQTPPLGNENHNVTNLHVICKRMAITPLDVEQNTEEVLATKVTQLCKASTEDQQDFNMSIDDDPKDSLCCLGMKKKPHWDQSCLTVKVKNQKTCVTASPNFPPYDLYAPLSGC